MSALTVAEASGLIAAGVFVLQLFLPLALPAILIAFIADEYPVITWNVLGRYLHSSLWPSILSTSTAAVTGVQRRVTVTGWIQTIGLGIISVASICTPLGLYDSIEQAQSTTNVTFGYLQDKSAFGSGTPPRTSAPFTRTCGLEQACPGASLNKTCHKQGLLENCTVIYESRIPESLLGLFGDGATEFSPSVSSIGDMQYRTYINGTDGYSVLGWYAKPFYRSLQVLILDEKVEPVEGLIVDMKHGGIGFRNHTGPVRSSHYGSTWNEDILFVEPETQCVSLNLTLDFELPLDRETNITAKNLALTDHGGLSDLAGPGPSLKAPVNGQGEFDLRERALNAAWLNNFLTLVYFNATDPNPSAISRLDVVPHQRFDIPKTANISIGYRNIQSTIEFGQYLDLTRKQGNGASSTLNPHGVTREDFDLITTLCGGSTSSSPSNINSTIIGCGIVFGAATRTDGVSSLLTDPGSPWSIPMYSCATAIRAVVKTVSFQYNGTGFENLRITSVRPKEYKDTADLPVWGVEKIPDQTLAVVQPMWGVVKPDWADTSDLSPVNISTISGNSLYLPGYIDQNIVFDGMSPVPISGGQNLPGVEFYKQALYRALSINQAAGQPYADYSGWTSFSLYAKWQKLSTSASGAASIINLVWTDFAANAVVGTKGQGLNAAATRKSASASGMDDSITSIETTVEVPVTLYERKVRYHLAYAVPAFVVLAATLALTIALTVLMLMGRTGMTRMKSFLERTSIGTILWLLLWPRTEDKKNWVKEIGGKRVRISDDGVTVKDESLLSPVVDEQDREKEDGGEVTEVLSHRESLK